MRLRTPAAVLLTGLLVAATSAQAPKDPPKEPEPAAKPKSIDWPKEISGKDAAAWVKDTTDLDPAIREAALRTLPNFGPAAKKVAGKAILARMSHQKERDTGVRYAAYATAALMGFDDPAENTEAVRLLFTAADEGVGQTRLNALTALASFGPKAVTAVTRVIGPSVSDPWYEIRRQVAFTLGRIGYDEKNGPRREALHCLTGTLINDHSAAVRVEAMQALLILGPPWLIKADPKDPKAPPPPKDKLVAPSAPLPDMEEARKYMAPIKRRLGLLPGTKATETDRQVEIWGRLVLMRFDPKEMTDDNLKAIAKHISGSELGPKLQALSALGLMGPAAKSRLDDIVKALGDTDPTVATAAVNALVGLGSAAKPAIPEIEKLKGRGTTPEEKKYFEELAGAAVKSINEAPSPGESPGTTGSPEAPPPAPKK